MKTYRHLLSPLQVGKYILKNRILATNATPHFLQGPETFPAEATILYYANLAKNGAAIVSVCDNYATPEKRKIPVADICRFPVYDKDDPSVDNYISQIAETIKFYGSIPCAAVRAPEFDGYNVSGGHLEYEDHPDTVYREVTKGMLKQTIEGMEKIAKHYWTLGFRMLSIPMGYSCSLSARFLAPRLNRRTDEYGGALENRAKYPLELCNAVKRACPDMLLEIIVSGESVDGVTLDETVRLAKLGEDVIDFLQLRCETGVASHPTGFNSAKGGHQTIRYAEAVKKSGANVIVVPVGGYHDPDECEYYLAEGKTDMFGMGRSFICDYEYGAKLVESRGEDVVPCIRCNKCHMMNMTGPWISVCSVNPQLGLRQRLNHLVSEPGPPKKTAVIGGGPAGMEAAITAARRGHRVTLYEKEKMLGGQLFHADYVSFKWPLKDFKDFLIRQLPRWGVEVHTGEEATPDAIESMGYDAVIVAIGSKPNQLPIPGADSTQVKNPLQVFGREEEIGARVVVVGGAETGLETALHLAAQGRDVTLLTRQKVVAPETERVHYREYLEAEWSRYPNLCFFTEAKTVEIKDDAVVYVDNVGTLREACADTVIVSGGMASLSDEAVAYSGCARYFFVAGDCQSVGNLQTAMRSGYAAALGL